MTDPDGAVMPGVDHRGDERRHRFHPARGLRMRAVSIASTLMPSGNYEFKATLAGFKTEI